MVSVIVSHHVNLTKEEKTGLEGMVKASLTPATVQFEYKEKDGGEKVTIAFRDLPQLGINWQSHFEEKFPRSESYQVVIL